MDLHKIIAILIFTVGMGVIIKIIYIYYFYNIRIKTWHKIQGEILDSGSEYFISKTDADNEGWKYKVLYKYKINDKEYFNNIIGKNIGLLLPSENSVDKYENKYEKGHTINVYYNPKNPSDSIIDDKFDVKNLISLLIGIVAAIVSIYLWQTST